MAVGIPPGSQANFEQYTTTLMFLIIGRFYELHQEKMPG
jgi:hypothetical protein